MKIPTKKNQNKTSMVKPMGPFRDSRAPSRFSGPRTNVPIEPHLIGPVTPTSSTSHLFWLYIYSFMYVDFILSSNNITAFYLEIIYKLCWPNTIGLNTICFNYHDCTPTIRLGTLTCYFYLGFTHNQYIYHLIAQ